MEIVIKLHYVLKSYAPGGDYRKPFTLTVPGGSHISHALTALGMPPDGRYLLFVGTERVTRERELKDGDTVTILPPIVGG